jgi:hypothetical protein
MGSEPGWPDYSGRSHLSCLERADALLPGPMISEDGSVVVVPVVDDDGMRGNANLSTWFFDTKTGMRRSTLTLLSVEESADDAALAPRICARQAELASLLRTARVQPLLPVSTNGVGSEPLAGCLVTAKLRAGATDKEPSLELLVNGRKAFKKNFTWYMSRDPRCPAQFFSADVWVGSALGVLLVVASYSTGPDTCPSYYQFIVTTALRV